MLPTGINLFITCGQPFFSPKNAIGTGRSREIVIFSILFVIIIERAHFSPKQAGVRVNAIQCTLAIPQSAILINRGHIPFYLISFNRAVSIQIPVTAHTCPYRLLVHGLPPVCRYNHISVRIP